MSDQIPPIKLGYYDPFDVFAKLKNDLETKVQLTNLHWRKNNKDTLKSIPQLPTIFVEETPKIFDNNTLGAGFKFSEVNAEELLERTVRLLNVPYTRLMFIECENIDTYKSKVRPLIKEWIKSCVDKSNGPVDWYLVFFVPNSDAADTKSKTRVFEKLRLDFTAEGEIDRCIKLKSKYSNTLEENESWNSLVGKLKNGILYSFTERLETLRNGLVMLNDDKEKRNSNLMAYFALLEGFARQFLLMHLFEDALGEYDRLASVLKEHQNNSSYFPNASLDFSSEHKTNLMELVSSECLFTVSDTSLSLFKLKAYVFAKQFVVLDSLSDSASSMSISSIHVSEFLRRLHVFSAEIVKLYATSEVQKVLVSEWSYQLIDEVLSRDVCVKISNLAAEQSDENISQISERFGELILVQRSQLIKVGQTLNFNIGGILSDIDLYDVDDTKGSTDIHYTPLKQTLESYKSFENKYITLTGEAIKHFSIAGRPRSVDALSIDVALLDYQNKNYEKAAEVFSTCPDFYGAQGWELISKSLLEIYADCLEHMDEKAEFFSADENSISRETLLCKVYLDIISSMKSKYGGRVFKPEVIEETFKKFEKIAPLDDVEYAAETLFDIEPMPHLSFAQDDTLLLNVKVNSPFFRELNLKNAKILLNNIHGDILEFHNESLIINHGLNNVPFSATNIVLGEFKFQQFSAMIGNVRISEDFNDSNEVFIFTYPTNMLLEVGNSTNINLTTKSISMFINTGVLSVKKSKIRLWSKTDGFEPISGIKAFKLSDNSSIELAEQDPENLTLSTNELEANTSYEVVIPYIISGSINTTILDLKAQISYETEHGDRSQTVAKYLDTSFSIAVSVQDIFKNTGLYAKFSIGTADIDFPIRILSTDLESNEKYEVSTSFKAPSLIAFGEQPGSFFYKIQKREGVKYSEDDFLTLDIRYRDLKEEIKQILKKHLSNELVKTGYEKYLSLLELLLNDLKFNYTHYVTEKEIEIAEAIQFNKKLTDSISEEDRAATLAVFENSIKDIRVPDLAHYQLRDRHLFIDVQIPSVQVVHTVEFKIDQATHYVIGQAINTLLEINSFMGDSQDKDSHSKKKVQFESEISTKTHYSVELLTNQDSWLINGKTKFKFDLDKSETNKVVKLPVIELSLIPLKVGKLALPKIHILNEGIDQSDEYLMEVDYKNENETLYIVSEAINE